MEDFKDQEKTLEMTLSGIREFLEQAEDGVIVDIDLGGTSNG